MKTEPSDIAREIRWDIDAARQFTLELLTEVNDHTMRARVQALFEEEQGPAPAVPEHVSELRRTLGIGHDEWPQH